MRQCAGVAGTGVDRAGCIRLDGFGGTGNTLTLAGTGTVSIFSALGKPPYDIIKDFAPVSMIGSFVTVRIRFA